MNGKEKFAGKLWQKEDQAVRAQSLPVLRLLHNFWSKIVPIWGYVLVKKRHYYSQSHNSHHVKNLLGHNFPIWRYNSNGKLAKQFCRLQHSPVGWKKQQPNGRYLKDFRTILGYLDPPPPVCIQKIIPIVYSYCKSTRLRGLSYYVRFSTTPPPLLCADVL